MQNRESLKNSNRAGTLSIIISDEEDSIWAYLVNNNMQIIADCWLANKTNEELKSFDYYKKNNLPIPAKKEYVRANIFSLDFNKLDFQWMENEQSVIVLYDNQKIVLLNSVEKIGYSRNLSENCAWGKTWEI